MKKFALLIALALIIEGSALAGMEADMSIGLVGSASVSATGTRTYDWQPVGLTGITFWRRPDHSGVSLGFSFDVGALPSSGGGVNAVPAVALQVGTSDRRFFLGVTQTPDGNPGRAWAPFFGVRVAGRDVGAP